MLLTSAQKRTIEENRQAALERKRLKASESHGGEPLEESQLSDDVLLVPALPLPRASSSSHWDSNPVVEVHDSLPQLYDGGVPLQVP